MEKLIDVAREEEEEEEETYSHSILQRAWFMFYLLYGYNIFKEMQENKKMIDLNLNYKQAEFISDIVQDIFDVDCEVTDFLTDKDTLANASIDKYRELQKYLVDVFEEEYRPAVMAFYKNVYYDNSRSSIEIASNMKMCFTAVGAFLVYTKGLCSKEELQNNITSVNAIGQRKDKIDSVYVRRLLMELEDTFYEILEIRKQRREAKENEASL